VRISVVAAVAVVVAGGKGHGGGQGDGCNGDGLVNPVHDRLLCFCLLASFFIFPPKKLKTNIDNV
jgi:hypothetical protein